MLLRVSQRQQDGLVELRHFLDLRCQTRLSHGGNVVYVIQRQDVLIIPSSVVDLASVGIGRGTSDTIELVRRSPQVKVDVARLHWVIVALSVLPMLPVWLMTPVSMTTSRVISGTSRILPSGDTA
jgi:hypothetical protein